MSARKPKGWSTVTPRLFAEDVSGLVGFLRAVFGARGEVTAGGPAEMVIGDSIVMVSGSGTLREPSKAFLYVYVEDADAACSRAAAAGAEIVEEPADTHYGDRRATVRDPFGNTWQIATYKSRR
jgi:uncharacterized glyoxalase superfamily protein PhnB